MVPKHTRALAGTAFMSWTLTFLLWHSRHVLLNETTICSQNLIVNNGVSLDMLQRPEMSKTTVTPG